MGADTRMGGERLCRLGSLAQNDGPGRWGGCLWGCWGRRGSSGWVGLFWSEAQARSTNNHNAPPVYGAKWSRIDAVLQFQGFAGHRARC